MDTPGKEGTPFMIQIKKKWFKKRYISRWRYIRRMIISFFYERKFKCELLGEPKMLTDGYQYECKILTTYIYLFRIKIKTIKYETM